MTIGKKLYVNFGIILSMVVVLFIVNLLAVQREHAAKAAATASLQLADATNEVRFQMMQNRLYLSNYLLSGDSREVDRMNEGLRTLTEKLQQGKTLANSEQERSALDKVSTTGAGLEQRIRPAPDRQTQGCGLWQCDRRGIADLLPSEGCLLVGEEFDRRAGRGRRGKQQTGGSRHENRMRQRAPGRLWLLSSAHC